MTLLQPAPGMGAVFSTQSTTFRVWAPNATSVCVRGEFNDWNETNLPLLQEGQGYWVSVVEGVRPGQMYAFRLENNNNTFDRVDPYARQVTGEGNDATAVVVDTQAFDWGVDSFLMPNWNELVIYELHIGSFKANDAGGNGTFATAITQLDYLQNLGINCLNVLPVAEFNGEASWGYNTNYPFAVETTYGGPDGFKALVKAAHQHGIGVIVDVVYNHLGPDGKHLWLFDGWSENGGGGIYFYNDHRAETPWGHTRLDYGREEVRRYIIDNALMWLEEYRADGLRLDSVSHIHSINGNHLDPEQKLPEGWQLLQEINREVHEKFPWKITIAEDLLSNAWITKPIEDGGAGFDSQWDSQFVRLIRQALTASSDDGRSMELVSQALTFNFGAGSFQRVIYTESHDEAGEGSFRMPVDINADDPHGYFAVIRSIMAIVLASITPGIPMIFQGQEFLASQEFAFPQSACLDWELARRHTGIVRLVSDAFKLRRNLEGRTLGLTGNNAVILHVSDSNKLIAFYRWENEGGPNNSVVVVCNFSAEAKMSYRIGLPQGGRYQNLLNTSAQTYNEYFSNLGTQNMEAESIEADSQAQSALVDIGPYSILVFGLV